jgi:hypothetical protein
MKKLTVLKNKKVILPAIVVLLVVASFLFGRASHSDKKYLQNSLASQHKMMNAKPASVKPSKTGTNTSFGGFNVHSKIKIVTSEGVIVTTSGGNEITILLNSKTIILNNLSKKIELSSLKVDDTIVVAVRVNPNGQFEALRITKQ